MDERGIHRNLGRLAPRLQLASNSSSETTMSVRPGLMAVSRVGVSSSALRAQWVRCASDSSRSKTATVQDTDKQIKDRQRMMRRLPPGFDTSAAYAPVVFGELTMRVFLTDVAEPVVDPPFSVTQLLTLKYKREYLWQRFKRELQSMQMYVPPSVSETSS